MRLVVKTARDKEIPAKVSGNKLQVNNITYDYRNLDCLPTGLKPGDIMVKEIGGSIVFSSEHAWISNFYPTPVKIQDVVFNSSEQAFQYIKARRNNEPELAAQILKAKLAKEVKKISKGISIKPDWDMYKEEVMTRVIEAKFTQNELLARKLVETGSKRLVEATMDKYWAAFATPTSKSIANGTWKGANRLGILLMELRNKLRREYPDAIPVDQQTIDPEKKSPAPGPSHDSSSQSSSKPVAPTRHRRNKRGNDERSPPVLPASQYQKLVDEQMNVSYGVPASKSPIKATITPPIADLFEVPTDQTTSGKSAPKLLGDNLFDLPDETIPSSSEHVERDSDDHTVYIGSQHI